MNNSLIARNNEILSQFKNISFSKRLKNELIIMYPNYDQIDIEVVEKTKVKVSVYKIANDNQFYRYEFIVPQDYPFRSPAIFFQGRPYIDFLKMHYAQKESSLFKKVTGLNCFCCYSINCADNWGPGITLEKIIAEIHTIKKKRRDIINKILADKIKQKYLIADIDLDSWLY